MHVVGRNANAFEAFEDPHRADEMTLMLRLARDFRCKIRGFHHALEAYKIADRLAEACTAALVGADWWGQWPPRLRFRTAFLQGRGSATAGARSSARLGMAGSSPQERLPIHQLGEEKERSAPIRPARLTKCSVKVMQALSIGRAECRLSTNND
jgi:hypothetical protein